MSVVCLLAHLAHGFRFSCDVLVLCLLEFVLWCFLLATAGLLEGWFCYLW